MHITGQAQLQKVIKDIFSADEITTDGANSGVFQGMSVFVGLIVSLGSSTVIGNIIAGFVITYT